jgi:hypothetical protein
MKLNWGSGIFLFILLFLAACSAFIIYTTREKWSLVEEDYYPKELRHEEKLVKMRNANGLKEQLQFRFDKSSLILQFPADFHGKAMTGKVDVYRPSDETLDLIIPVSVDTSLVQLIPLNKLSHGRYVMKVEWRSEGKEYYKELDIYIP